QRLNTGNFTLTLADGDIDTIHILTFLVDNCINRNRGLACLAVTNNQLTLTTTNRDHRINGYDTCLDRTVNAFTLHNARCNPFDIIKSIWFDWTFAIEGVTQRINNTTNQAHTHRHGSDTS